MEEEDLEELEHGGVQRTDEEATPEQYKLAAEAS